MAAPVLLFVIEFLLQSVKILLREIIRVDTAAAAMAIECTAVDLGQTCTEQRCCHPVDMFIPKAVVSGFINGRKLPGFKHGQSSLSSSASGILYFFAYCSA